jgi:nitrogen-specific signal transduction histidine kinase/ActR/RegA family two-component response regulator
MRRREEIEGTLRQTQKMEAIGQLTGGIAHDFNNMLTIVIGNLDTLQRRLRGVEPEMAAPLSKPVESAMKGARSAAKLTHRLLAFARQQPLAPKPLDIRTLVAGMSDMLTRMAGEPVKIETVSGAGLWPVLVDENQLENALLNLVVNARDAMPNGGQITIETSNAYLDDSYVAHIGDIKSGQYVMLSVSDTGSGIPADKIEKVFEPFFTTKPSGQGTGLGLAMIHGFVKQSGGHIRIYSELEQGTTVKIYLPRMHSVDLPVAEMTERKRHLPRAVEGKTILLVEDDDGVRDYAVEVLQDAGYQVVAVGEGRAALRALEGLDRVDLLFTDVVLGGELNGRQVAEQVTKLRPNLPVLFTTGYTRNAIVHHGRLDAGVNLLNKPYTSHDLTESVRSLIDRSKGADNGTKYE